MLSSFLRLLLLIAAGFIISQIAAAGILFASGFEISNGSLASISAPKMKLILLISHLLTFIIPCFIFIYLNYKEDKWKQLRLIPKLDLNIALLCLILIVVSYPAVTYSYTVNSWIPLAEWMTMQEDNTAATLEKVLQMDNVGEFLFNIFLVAIIPAIGEELLFRGLIQDFIEKSSKNIHFAVWGAALAFSLFHLQFEGFLPRLLLGALLGYSFIFTRNLWVPILFHFLNNALPIVSLYFFGDDLAAINPEDTPDIHWAIGVGSLLLGASLIFYISNKSKKNEFSQT